MHQKIIISFSFAFAVAILSIFGSIILNKVSATSDTFALPSGGPASFQIPAPINVSQSNQTKTGGITLGKDLWIRPSISSSQKSGILLFSKNESQGLPGYIYNDKGALKYQTLSSNNPNTASYTTVFEVDKGGNTNISGNLTVNKQTKLNSNTDISGNLTVSGNINTTGTLTTQNLKVNGDTTFTNLNVNNQLKLSGETVLTGSSQIPWGNIDNVPLSQPIYRCQREFIPSFTKNSTTCNGQLTTESTCAKKVYTSADSWKTTIYNCEYLGVLIAD